MRLRSYFILYIVALLLQGTLAGLVSIGGYGPNLLLVLTVVLCYRFNESVTALCFSTIFGLIYDACFSPFMGIGTWGLFLVGLLILALNRLVNREHILPMLVITALSTVCYNLIYWIGMLVFEYRYSILFVLEKQPFYIIYNVIIALILFVCMNRSIEKKSSGKKKSRYSI